MDGWLSGFSSLLAHLEFPQGSNKQDRSREGSLRAQRRGRTLALWTQGRREGASVGPSESCISRHRQGAVLLMTGPDPTGSYQVPLGLLSPHHTWDPGGLAGPLAQPLPPAHA